MKIKVLHLITRWLESGGAEKNTLMTIESLSRDKYEIALAIGGDSETEPLIPGVKIFKINSLKRNIAPLSEIRAFVKILLLIRKEKFEIVHTHQSKAGFLGRLAAKIGGVPVVIHTVHGPLFHENQNLLLKWFYLFLEKIAALFTDWFVFVGNDLKDYYLKYGVGEPARSTVIRSWIDLEKFKRAADYDENKINLLKEEMGLESRTPLIGMVGRLEKSKGWEEALAVAAKVIARHPQAKFLFVGKGSFLPKLKEKIRKAGLENSVFLPGFRNEVEKIMAVFDILMLTSPKEGLSQILVQGAVMGKPLVCFDVLGAREMIKENGFIIPDRDKEAMAEKINLLLADLPKAKEMGKKGMALVNEEWSLTHIALKNNELYEKLGEDILLDREK